MDPYIVSARKYRPATFDMVVGQQSITNTLKNAIKNQQLAQAFLFCGPRGVGKTTCARILAKTINCKKLSEEIEPCNTCDSCTSFDRSASFNVYELDAASNNSVEDIRSLVEQVRIPPQAGKYKVYIIDEVHMLSLAAFNAFLKTLEEPPAYAKFILATTEKHKIIPTILSRCQIFDFKRITVRDIATHLSFVAEKEGVTADQDALQIVALKADGSLRDALSIFDQLLSFTGNTLTYKDVIENLNVLDFEYYFRMTRNMLDGDLRSALLLIHEVLGNGFDGQHFLVGMGEHFRNLLVAMDESTAVLLEVADSYKSRYHEQARECSEAFLLKALEISNHSDINYKAANNKQLHIEIGILKLCSLTGNDPAPASGKKKTIKPDPMVAEPAPGFTPPAKSIPAHKDPVKEEKQAPPATRARIGLSLDSKISKQGTVSLGNEEEEAQEEDTVLIGEDDIPETPFREDDLHMYWQSFIGSYREEKRSLYSTLAANKPLLIEGWKVLFDVENKVQKLEIEDIKGDILEHLRTKLENGRISLEINIVKKESGNGKPYTAQEKFKYMSEKNPAVKELRDRLNLDIDY